MLTLKMLRARRVAGAYRDVNEVVRDVPVREATDLVALGHAVQMPTEETKTAESTPVPPATKPAESKPASKKRSKRSDG